MTNVSRTNLNGLRPASDLYQTPPECTRALIKAVPEILKAAARVWEPAAGKGAIVRELERAGCRVTPTDKFSHGHGWGGRPFECERRLLAPVIVTNPPYGKVTAAGGTINVADPFIRHALSLNPQYAFFFLPLTYWSGIGRTDILEHLGLWRVFILRNRPTLSPESLKLPRGGVTDYAWFGWKRGHQGLPEPHRITLERTAKPDGLSVKVRAAMETVL